MTAEDNIGVGPSEDWGNEVEDYETETTASPAVASLLEDIEIQDDAPPPPRELNDPAVVTAIKEKILSAPEGKAIRFPGILHRPLMSAVMSLRKSDGRQFPTKSKFEGSGKDKVVEAITVWT